MKFSFKKTTVKVGANLTFFLLKPISNVSGSRNREEIKVGSPHDVGH